jgi:hypothetical protein
MCFLPIFRISGERLFSDSLLGHREPNKGMEKSYPESFKILKKY